MTSTRRALIVRGGWDGHQPVETTDSVIPFLTAQGFDVRIADTPRVYRETATRHLDLIVQSVTMAQIERDDALALRDAVAGGVGLAGWHGGIVDAFRASAEYLQLVGGQFAAHPPKPIGERRGNRSDNDVSHRIDIVSDRSGHPIVDGLKSFAITTEQYWVLTDDYNDVLATTTLAAREDDPWTEPVTVPAVWTRAWGAGRVFVATPGHSLEVLNHPDVRTILERGLLWAAR